MKPVILCLYVLVPVMDGNNYVCPRAVNPREECVHLALDFGDRSSLRFLPSSVGSLSAHTVNPVMRVLPVRFVYTADLQIHSLSLSP